MGTYIDYLNDLFEAPKERTFTDRTEVLNLLNEALIKLNEDPTTFQIFSIHGIGGIGKTRLVKEFAKLLDPEPVIFVSLEIEKRSEIVNNLWKIRKEIKYSCPFFDFALLRYWEMTNPAVIDDSFIDIFQKGFFVSILDFVAEIAGGPITNLKSEFQPPYIITPSSLIDFVNAISRKIPQFKHSALFKAIFSTSTIQLLKKLPTILGMEIGHLVSTGKILSPIFIFDSYQESQPYSESEEWLYHLIKSAGIGLYIVTSREPLHWNKDSDHLILHRLQCYPENDARILLEETIIDRPDLVDQIIASTQCIPIYIDLALNVYENQRAIVGEKLVKKALFCDRYKLVHHFINHMKPSWQSVVLDLATIRLFNNDIFQHLVRCKMLDCAPYEYATIIESNLFSYVSKSKNSNLVKLHDVFCKDAQNGRSVCECYSIYKAYLDYICYRRDVIVNDNNGASLAALFQNVLHIAIYLEERFYSEEINQFNYSIDKSVVEQILDIFFTLVANKVQFIPIPFENIKTEVMKKVCQFVHIKTYEKINTRKTIEALERIGDISCFGKHTLSYEAVLFYTKSLAGNYNELQEWVNKIDANLDDQSKCEWFYNRIKIYQADCNMLNGRFKTALGDLFLLNNGYMSTEDYYSIHRTIGHIQRFNFLLKEAEHTYSSLMMDYHKNSVYREYLVANIAETQCFFPDSDFIRRNKKVLASMETPYNTKNKGKLLYALAIANIVKKHYRIAKVYIEDSIKINYEDGYQSGELFAYIAQAYLDYALTGTVTEETNFHIEQLLACNNVYNFFRLQLAIIREDQIEISGIAKTYDWIDFAKTEKALRQFLSQLRNT